MRRSAAPSQLRPGFLPSGPSPTTSTPPASFVDSPLSSSSSTPPPLSSSHSVSTNGNKDSNVDDDDNRDRYFTAIWCKVSTRKHKKWEDDALLHVRPSSRLAVLKSLEGKELGRGTSLAMAQLVALGAGGSISFSGKEVEIAEEITEDAYRKMCKSEGSQEERSMNPKEDVVVFRPKVINQAVFKPFSAPSKFGGTSFIPPVVRTSSNTTAIARADALILPRPPFDPFAAGTDQDKIKDVIVDHHLSKQLRPHQREGVVFLYNCVMSFNDSGCSGAILADEMGLGKTLQTITLIWTLMRQGPWLGGRPVIKSTLILAPSSLVSNWQAEFAKWLGTERIRVYAVDPANRVTEYLKSPNWPVLIMSYEMFVRSFDDLLRVSFDLIICDEGHRLKNEKIKAATLLSQMTTERRVVLTGTPLQNDLKEFYSIVCAVNPRCFGSAQAFAREFEEVIVRSKQPGASEEDIESGEIKLEELNRVSSKFILRRTQDIISKYLPPKTEYVLFCKPTPLQAYLYKRLVDGLDYRSLETTCVLTSILHLRKVCNHPSLSEVDQEQIDPTLLEATLEEQGSKLAVVSLLLNSLRQSGSEKIVLVSISTKVLDLLENLCSFYNYPCLRLDGSTSTNQRQSVVKRFNSPHGDDFVLLLSSKAGGTGLNLIGASRILLYDMDWNPAHDSQAMARVWRDGQTRPVVIYRLATTGTIEEKIFQRQITKQGLGGGIAEEAATKPTQFHFSTEELRDLFSFDEGTSCSTHDLLECSCDGSGENNARTATVTDKDRVCQLGVSDSEATSAGSIRDLLQWRHIKPSQGMIEDTCLETACPFITFALQNVQV